MLKYRPNDIILISSECANSKTHCLFVNWFFSFLWGLHEKFRKKNFSLMTGGHKTEILELVTDRWLNFIDLRFICSLPSHQWRHILLPIQGLFQKVPVYNVLVLLALTCLQVFSKSPFNDRRHNPLSMVTLPSNLHKNFEAIFGWQNMLSFWAGLKQKICKEFILTACDYNQLEGNAGTLVNSFTCNCKWYWYLWNLKLFQTKSAIIGSSR